MIERLLTPANRRYLRAVGYGLAAIILAALAIGVRDTRLVVSDVEAVVEEDLRPGVDELRLYLRANRESRIHFQANERFLLCSRDFSTIVQPDLIDDVDKACDGYETPESALRNERQLQEEIQTRLRGEMESEQDPDN